MGRVGVGVMPRSASGWHQDRPPLPAFGRSTITSVLTPSQTLPIKGEGFGSDADRCRGGG